MELEDRMTLDDCNLDETPDITRRGDDYVSYGKGNGDLDGYALVGQRGSEATHDTIEMSAVEIAEMVTASGRSILTVEELVEDNEGLEELSLTADVPMDLVTNDTKVKEAPSETKPYSSLRRRITPEVRSEVAHMDEFLHDEAGRVTVELEDEETCETFADVLSRNQERSDLV